MEVGHDDGNLQSITGCKTGDKPRLRESRLVGAFREAVLAESRGSG